MKFQQDKSSKCNLSVCVSGCLFLFLIFKEMCNSHCHLETYVPDSMLWEISCLEYHILSCYNTFKLCWVVLQWTCCIVLFYCALRPPPPKKKIPLQPYFKFLYQSSKYGDMLFYGLITIIFLNCSLTQFSSRRRVMATLMEQGKTIGKDFMKYSQLSLSVVSTQRFYLKRLKDSRSESTAMGSSFKWKKCLYSLYWTCSNV